MSKKQFLEKIKEMPREILYLVLIADIYLVGMVLHAFSVTLPYMLLFTPVILLLFGLLALYPAWLEGNRRLLIWILVTYAITLFLEIVGVKTGIVFGSYHYGPVLGLKVGEVPLVIGFNWVIVVLGFVRLSERITDSAVIGGLLTGALCVAYDYVLEPVAIGLDYWQWHGPVIPLQNYIAWFLIATAAAWVYRFMHIRMQSNLPTYYVGIQFLFFIGLQLFAL